MKKEMPAKRQLMELPKYGLEDVSIEGLIRLRFFGGEYVYECGQPVTYLLLVLSGSAKVCVLGENGKTLLLAFYTGKGLIGDVELFEDSALALHTVQAITEFVCIGIPLTQYRSTLLQSPAFLRYAAGALAGKLSACGRNCAVNILYQLDTRLCTYIEAVAEGGVFRGSLVELSELLGVSYRHLHRTLQALCLEGILEKGKGLYKIANPQALKARARDYYFTD